MTFTAYIELECEVETRPARNEDSINDRDIIVITLPGHKDKYIICYGDLPASEKRAITRAYQVALQAEVAKHRDDSIN